MIVSEDGTRIHDQIEFGGAMAPPPPPGPRPALSEIEADVVEAIGREVMTADEVAEASGYPNDAGLRATLARLRRAGILSGGKGESGYGVLQRV